MRNPDPIESTLYLHAESQGCPERPVSAARGVILGTLAGAACWAVLGAIWAYWRAR